MDLQPAPGTASLDSLTDVSVSSASNGQVLYVSAGSWINGSPNSAGLVDLANSQTITGVKTYTANVQVDNGIEVRFFELDANGSNFIGLRAPDSLSGDVTYTLPPAGSSGQFAKLGASSDISWASLAIADLSDNTDLALLAGRAGGQTIKGSPNSGENLILQANNSANGFVVVQASGGLLLKTLASVILEDNTGGEYVALRATDPVTSSYIIQLPGTAGSSGQVLQITGVGGSTITTSWVTPGASVDHGSLTGLADDDHTQYAAIAGRSGGQTVLGGTVASNNLVLGSTSDSTKGEVQIQGGSALALRATATGSNELRFYEDTDNGTHYTAFKAAASIASSHTYILPSAIPGSTQYLASDSLGNLSWGTPGGGGSGVNVHDHLGAGGVSAATTIYFDTTDGFVLSNPSGSIAQVDLADDGVPVAKITKSGTAGQVVVTVGGATAWGVALIAGGGTGISSYTAGDTLYYASSTALSKLAIGTAGQQLTVNSAGDAPSWAEPSATEVESWRFEYTNSTTVTLRRLGNARLRIAINGRVYESNSDVTAAVGGSIFDGGGGADDTIYYAYVYDNSGTLTIEFSTIAPNTQVPGVYAYKTGFTTRRYIGKVLLATGPNFVDGQVWSAANRHFKTIQLFNDCRISISSTETVPTADIGSSSTIYLHPHRGNRISLYNSTTGEWECAYIASAVSLGLSLMTSGKNYDVFAYLDGPKVKLVLGPAWTDDTNRSATTIARTDGVFTKSDDQTRLYIGTIRATGASTTQDSASARYVYSYFNQEPRHLTVTGGSSSYNLSTPIRQYAASTANQVNFLLGVSQNVSLMLNMSLYPGTVSSQIALGGMGLDTTTSYIGNMQRVYNRGYESSHSAPYNGVVSAGYHYVAALQSAGGSYTCNYSEFEITGVIRA